MSQLTIAAVFIVLASCTGGGGATGSSCPTTDAPTFANFGQQFFASYCNGCHSSSASNRNGAPGNQNYDTEALITTHLDEIDAEAASGPDATNTSMPELGGTVATAPSTAERARLGEYLACLRGN